MMRSPGLSDPAGGGADFFVLRRAMFCFRVNLPVINRYETVERRQ